MKTTIADDMLSETSRTRLLLATQAFGMGVNSPDIRRVVHAGAPTTLEGKLFVIYESSLNASWKYVNTLWPKVAIIHEKSDIGWSGNIYYWQAHVYVEADNFFSARLIISSSFIFF